jgi:hypothetical protein
MTRRALIRHRLSPWLNSGMSPSQRALLHNRVACPEAHNTAVARQRRSVQKLPNGAVKGPALNNDTLEEIEQESGGIYGVKGRSIKGKQIGWFLPVNSSQSRLKRKKKPYSFAKVSRLSKEEGALTSAPQQKKNQCVSSLQIVSKIGFVITWDIHCYIQGYISQSMRSAQKHEGVDTPYRWEHDNLKMLQDVPYNLQHVL